MAPDHGFNPLTATEAQVHAHDFPPRPTNPAMLSVWQGYVATYLAGKARIASSCDENPSVLHTDVTAGANFWSGNVAHNATYTDIETEFVVPTCTKPAGAQLATWIGIGLGTSKTYPLVQGGAICIVGGINDAFVETFYPGEVGGNVVAGMTGIAGHEIYLHIQFNNTGSVYYHFVDMSNHGLNEYPPAQYTFSGMKPDGHAEWISENPNGEAQPLVNFSPYTTLFDDEASAGSWQPLGSLSHYWTEITDSAGNVEAYPGAIDSTGTLFGNFFVQSN